MNRLIAELQRLYFLPGQPAPADDGGPALDLAGPDGRVRVLAVDIARGADWEQAAALYGGVQTDLDLPPPAVSVSGTSGYRLWFSLAEPVAAADALDFLEALRRRYLADLPPARLQCHPAPASPGRLDLPSALDPASGKWSAFIDPALGSMFMDEPGLEMAPNPDKQADLLAGLESIKAGDFRRVLNLLQSPPEPPGENAGPEPFALGVGGGFRDPKSFLLAVMNDPNASPAHRIEAAKALLPYFERAAPPSQAGWGDTGPGA